MNRLVAIVGAAAVLVTAAAGFSLAGASAQFTGGRDGLIGPLTSEHTGLDIARGRQLRIEVYRYPLAGDPNDNVLVGANPPDLALGAVEMQPVPEFVPLTELTNVADDERLADIRPRPDNLSADPLVFSFGLTPRRDGGLTIRFNDSSKSGFMCTPADGTYYLSAAFAHLQREFFNRLANQTFGKEMQVNRYTGEYVERTGPCFRRGLTDHNDQPDHRRECLAAIDSKLADFQLDNHPTGTPARSIVRGSLNYDSPETYISNPGNDGTDARLFPGEQPVGGGRAVCYTPGEIRDAKTKLLRWAAQEAQRAKDYLATGGSIEEGNRYYEFRKYVDECERTGCNWSFVPRPWG